MQRFEDGDRVCGRMESVAEPRTRRLANGMIAEIRADRWVRGAYELIVDGTPQSHVDISDPTHLAYEYVRRMGNLIDEVAAPDQPITAVHFGAGALTLPRYIEATRRGSLQQVIELERDLVDFVRDEIPWDHAASIRVRYGDAREVLGRLPAGLDGTADVVVVDVFTGAQTPPHVTSVEFYREVARLLAPDGIMLVNVADGPPQRYARSQAATLTEAVGPVVVLAESSVFKGRRFGNFVIAAARAGIPDSWLPRLFAAGPHPATVATGDELAGFMSGALVATDATATGSPAPNRGVFRFGVD